MDTTANKSPLEEVEKEELKYKAYQAELRAQGSVGCAGVPRASLVSEYRAQRDNLFARISVLTELIRDLENDPMFAEKLQWHMDLCNRGG